MRKNVLLLGAMMMASMSLMAQTKGGGISQSALQQMEKSQQSGIANKALFNAIANNNIDDLVKCCRYNVGLRLFPPRQERRQNDRG